MASEYVFEKSWVHFYAMLGLGAALWIVLTALGARLFLIALEQRRERSPEGVGKFKRLASLCFVSAVSLYSLGLGWFAFDLYSQFYTRFDRSGVRWLSASGWKSEPWSQVREARLITEAKGGQVRVLTRSESLMFSSVFASPQQVVPLLRAEVERHKKPREAAAEQARPMLNQARH